MKNYDEKARRDFKENPKSIYYWILAASYLYYFSPDRTPLLSDECFDRMCRALLDRYDSIPQHSMLAHLVSKEQLQAGSFYDILDNQYPLWLTRMAVDMSIQLDKQLGEK